MKNAKVLEKVNAPKQIFKSNKTAKDFYGIFKNVKVSSEELEKELDKSKKLWRF